MHLENKGMILVGFSEFFKEITLTHKRDKNKIFEMILNFKIKKSY